MAVADDFLPRGTVVDCRDSLLPRRFSYGEQGTVGLMQSQCEVRPTEEQ